MTRPMGILDPHLDVLKDSSESRRLFPAIRGDNGVIFHVSALLQVAAFMLQMVTVATGDYWRRCWTAVVVHGVAATVDVS